MSSSILYKVQEAGGAGRCFFNSLHDGILSREQEYIAKKSPIPIMKNMYKSFGIPMQEYDGKAALNEKKLQFNKDIRDYLAKKIRENPSEFQRMAERDFKEVYAEADNKKLYEYTKVRGEKDINNYPGLYDRLTDPDIYNLMTRNNELFEIQNAGAISADAIQKMGMQKFYALVADTLVKNNYTTYANEPIIFLLNFCLSKYSDYYVNIIFANENIQQKASIQSMYRDGKDLVAIPVLKTYGAHYQAIVQEPVQQDIDIAKAAYAKNLAATIEKSKKEAIQDVNTILKDTQVKFQKEILEEEEKEKEKLKKAGLIPIKAQLKQIRGDVIPLYFIPQEMFEVGSTYESVDTAGGEPIVEAFLLKAIRQKGNNVYELSIKMRSDGTETTILIDNNKGHFVSYTKVDLEDKAKVKEIDKRMEEFKKQAQLQQLTNQVETSKNKPKSAEDFRKKISEILGSSYTFEESKNTSTLNSTAKKPLSLDDFKAMIGYKKGGYAKRTRKTKGKGKSKSTGKSKGKAKRKISSTRRK